MPNAPGPLAAAEAAAATLRRDAALELAAQYDAAAEAATEAEHRHGAARDVAAQHLAAGIKAYASAHFPGGTQGFCRAVALAEHGSEERSDRYRLTLYGRHSHRDSFDACVRFFRAHTAGDTETALAQAA